MDPLVNRSSEEETGGVLKHPLTRRDAIRYAVVGTLGAAGIGSLIWYLKQQVALEKELSGVFVGGAPKPEVWSLWNQRGWVKEAAHYLKLGANVQCKLCPNNCLLAPGDRSHCRNKVNFDGKLYTMAYANPCTFHNDPVEKKPLFHFHPGSTTFSIATSGCGFRCLNCQNWEISQKTPEETKDPTGPSYRLRPPLPQQLRLEDIRRLSMFPEDVVALTEAYGCPSISYTYSEPVDYYEYVYDTAKLAHERRLKNIFVTCGFINEDALRDIAPHLDAAHVDLKGFDETVYQRLNSGHLEPILTTLKVLKELGVWFEIINLIVPTYTDNLDSIRKMTGWIVKNLGTDYPLHFSRFYPAHKLAHLSPTPVETLLNARDIARAEGLRYVYVGNVPGVPNVENTICPSCHQVIIERDVFAVTQFDLLDGKCPHCQTKIAGVW